MVSKLVCLKSVYCKSICLSIALNAFVLLGGVFSPAYAEDPPVYVSQFGSAGSDNEQFNDPRGIAIDSDGNLFVVDSLNSRIQKFSSSGEYLSQFGSYGSGNGQFVSPFGIAIDRSDNIWVADKLNDRIQKFSSSGIYISQLGPQGIGNGQFNLPMGIAIDRSDNIWVADSSNNRIQKFNSNGVYLSKFGTKGNDNGQFNSPIGIAFDISGNIYVAEYYNHRVQKFSSSGIYISQFGTLGSGNGQFQYPNGIAVDSSDNIFVTDMLNNRVQKFSSSGTYISQFGTDGIGKGQFVYPQGIAIDNSDNIYVVDFGNRRIQKFAYTATVPPSGTGNNNPSAINKAIIVAGGGLYDGNTLWNATKMNADYAYKALLRQGYTKDTVYYLSPVSNYDLDGNGKHDDVDVDATNSNFENAIRTWASDASELFIYIVDHGGDGTFRMNKTETLRAETLNQWLDAFQTNNPVRIVLVYDACRAGSFLPLLKSSAGKERILAASTSSDTEAVFASEGTGSYSFIFWARFMNGDSFYDSLIGAKKFVGLIYPKQVAQIDANGNGIPNEKEDLVLAENVRIGNETTFADDIPTIGSVSPEQMLNNQTSATIYAKDIVSTADISRVWAVITPPDYSSVAKDTPVTNLPIVYLSQTSNGRYEAVYRGFGTVGTYNIAVFAMDENGEVSLPVQTSVFRNSCIPVGNDLAMHLCAEYLGEKYGFTMNYTPNPKDTAGLYWKMDIGTFGSLSADTGNCLIVNEDLDMNLCVEYQGHNYAFTMNFYLNPYDISGLYWKMDVGTFREIQ